MPAIVILNSLHHGAYPSVGINAVWIVIAGFALLRARRKTKDRSNPTTD
jgi:hypothetical protein